MKFTALLPRQRRALAGVAVVAALTVPFSATPSGAGTHCNTTPVIFTPPGQPTFAVIPWAPYPSTINVQGESGVITDVNVTFNDFTYTFPEDVDVLLVAPDGSTRLLVFSDIGGNNDDVADSVTDVDLTFDDEAPTTPATDSQLSSGVYRPVDDDDANQVFGPDQFPAPAPDPGAATSLSVFDGLNPNGTWSLYVVDDEPGPPTVGDFGGGWCLNITTSATPTSSSTPTTGGPTTTSGPTTTAGPTTTLAPTTTVASTTTTTTPPRTCGGLTPTLVGTAAGETINGTPGPDVIVGGGGNDAINGLGGDDVICGGDGNDRLYGGDGNDRLFGDAGGDQLIGDAGNDALDGGTEPDQCFGGAGTDTAATCESVVGVP